MIIKDIRRIKDDIYANKRILAIDYGNKKIGLAISDQTQTIANPLIVKSYNNITEAIDYIISVVAVQDCEIIVIGLPLSDKGEFGLTAQQVKSFADILGKTSGLDIFFWDERYSTKAANIALNEANISGKNADILDDKIAASLILQGFLDYKKQ